MAKIVLGRFDNATKSRYALLITVVASVGGGFSNSSSTEHKISIAMRGLL